MYCICTGALYLIGCDILKIRVYRLFSKAPNSFKVPTGLYSEIDGELKGDFSPYAPVIRFSEITYSPTVFPDGKYCYIPKFSRYYFMSFAFVSGAWEASLTCDVLASFKSTVLATTQYVLRSASAYNQYLIDSACTPTTNVETALAATTQSAVWGATYETGTYVLGVVAPSPLNQLRNIGAVRYYAMTQVGFSALMYALLNSPNWMGIQTSEISAELQKALINPAQYIVSAVWLPIDAASFIGTTTEYGSDITQTIKLGWWDFNIGVNCRLLHEPVGEHDMYSKWLVIDYGLHPDTNDFGVWVNVSPYSKITLEFPPFGCIDLDTTDLNPAVHKISIHVFLHAQTGDAAAYIFNGDKENYPLTTYLIAVVRGNVGVQLPVGQVAMNVANWKNAAALGAVVGGEELVNILKGG